MMTCSGIGLHSHERGTGQTHNISCLYTTSLPKPRFQPPFTVLVLLSSLQTPIVYTSRAMTATEQHYSQIEKEALDLVWAYENDSTKMIRKCTMLETDHKPLVPLTGLTNPLFKDLTDVFFTTASDMYPTNYYTQLMKSHPFLDPVICASERPTILRALLTISSTLCQHTQTVFKGIMMPNTKMSFFSCHNIVKEGLT